MSDLEDQLTRELAWFDAAAGPRVDVAGVRRLATRERRRRQGLTVGAVAAAVALVVGLAGALPSRTSSVDPVIAPRVDAPLGLTWWEDETVHLPSGQTIVVDELVRVSARGDTTIVGTGENEPTAERWWRIDETGTAPRLVSLTGSFGSPTISLGGEHLAWVEEAGAGRHRVSSLDVATGEVSDVELPRGRGAETVLGVGGVDDRGRVLVERRGAPQLLWTPGGSVEVVGAGLPAGSGVVLLARGLAAVYDRDFLSAELWALPSVEGFAPLGDLRAVFAPSFNDDATAYVTADDQPTVVLIGNDGAQRVSGPLTLPTLAAGATWTVLGWESTTSVLMSDGQQWRRCSVTTSACEPVLSGMRSVASSV